MSKSQSRDLAEELHKNAGIELYAQGTGPKGESPHPDNPLKNAKERNSYIWHTQNLDPNKTHLHIHSLQGFPLGMHLEKRGLEFNPIYHGPVIQVRTNNPTIYQKAKSKILKQPIKTTINHPLTISSITNLPGTQFAESLRFPLINAKIKSPRQNPPPLISIVSNQELINQVKDYISNQSPEEYKEFLKQLIPNPRIHEAMINSFEPWDELRFIDLEKLKRKMTNAYPWIHNSYLGDIVYEDPEITEKISLR